MASRKKLQASIDWLQVKINDLTVDEIMLDLLGIPEEYFVIEDGSLKYYNYNCCYRFGDIRIYDYYETLYKREDQTDKMLLLSGNACVWYRDHWLSQSNMTFKEFMENLNTYEAHISITRLDIAIDDLNEQPFFTPTQLLKICQKKQFAYGKSTEYFPYGDENIGSTLNLKPDNADDRIRIYDKQAELAKRQGVRKKDMPPQIRTEVQFRREKAHQFFMLYVTNADSLLNLFQGYLKENVRFYTDTKFTKPLRSWQKFLGCAEGFRLSLTKEQVNLLRKIRWLKRGGGLAVYKAVKFLKENDIFPEEAETIEYELTLYPRELSHELQKYVTTVNRLDLIEQIHEDTKR